MHVVYICEVSRFRDHQPVLYSELEPDDTLKVWNMKVHYKSSKTYQSIKENVFEKKFYLWYQALFIFIL